MLCSKPKPWSVPRRLNGAASKNDAHEQPIAHETQPHLQKLTTRIPTWKIQIKQSISKDTQHILALETYHAHLHSGTVSQWPTNLTQRQNRQWTPRPECRAEALGGDRGRWQIAVLQWFLWTSPSGEEEGEGDGAGQVRAGVESRDSWWVHGFRTGNMNLLICSSYADKRLPTNIRRCPKLLLCIWHRLGRKLKGICN